MTAVPIRLELPTGFKFGSVNAYLFTEPEPVLVDTGLKSEVSWTALKSGLAEHRLAIADLTRVIVTHPHVDHCGQARRIADQSPSKIWIAALGASWLQDLPNLMLDRADYYQTYFLPRWNFPPELQKVVRYQLSTLARVCEAVPVQKTQLFSVGDFLQLGGLPWQVLYVPGHADTQTCFYQAGTRQLLSADMLLPRAPAPVLEKAAGDNTADRPALVRFLESLAMIDSLEIDMVYPGHGAPFDNHRQVIQQQRDRLAARRAECLSYIAAGDHTLAGLMEKMYTLDPAQFQLVSLWMLVGYVEWLKWQGQIEEQVEKGVAYYKKVER